MRIGIDGRVLSQNFSGVPRYVLELCKCLDIALPEASFFVYTQDAKGWVPPSDRWVVREEKVGFLRRIKPNLWLKLRMGDLCKNDSLDLFWADAFLLPRLPNSVVKSITVYDVIHLLFPKSMAIGNLLAFKICLGRDLRAADLVFSISHGTAARVEEHYGRKTDAVIYCSASPVFRPVPPEERDRVLAKYGLDGPYMMTVCVFGPRKNLDRLFDAVADLHAEGRLNGRRLVLVGRSGWKDEAILRRIDEYSKTWLMPLGSVSDEDLAAIYSGTDLLLFPSVYEGFGMPALEARSCGALVMANDSPEIREAAGENAIYAAGPDAPSLKAAIIDGLSRVEEHRRSPPPAVEWPSWQNGAQTMADHFRDAVRRCRNPT